MSVLFAEAGHTVYYSISSRRCTAGFAMGTRRAVGDTLATVVAASKSSPVSPRADCNT